VLPDEDLINPIEYRGVIYDADQQIGTGTAALIAQRNRRTIINWCLKGYLKSLKIGGPRGQYVIEIGDLVSFLQTPTPTNADVAA
jgi:hypothetical protein